MLVKICVVLLATTFTNRVKAISREGPKISSTDEVVSRKTPKHWSFQGFEYERLKGLFTWGDANRACREKLLMLLTYKELQETAKHVRYQELWLKEPDGEMTNITFPAAKDTNTCLKLNKRSGLEWTSCRENLAAVCKRPFEKTKATKSKLYSFIRSPCT